MSEPSTALTAVFYLRTASNRAGDIFTGIARQRSICQQRANELGLRVLGEYTDRGTTTRPDGQPGLAELLSDLPALKPDYVITFDHSRLAHKMAHYASIAWSIAKAGSRLEIASQPHRDANELAEEIITQIGSVQIVDFSNENTDSEKHDEK